MTATVEIKSWNAGVIVGDPSCCFTPIDWLTERVPATAAPLHAGASLVVELRRALGGRMPWALLGARFDPTPDESVELEIGHTGPWQLGGARSCKGPLGRPLAAALPLEVARGAMAGLTTCQGPLPPGRLTVFAGGYDEVESSFASFRDAACLLRLILPAALSEEGVTKQALFAALDSFASASEC